jgi:hypothetical protein
MTDTPNLGLPFIEGSQAQKHVTHNEGLRILDAAIQVAVLDLTRTAPPSSPTEGERHVVATGATGAWAGHANAIASWLDGAWAFLVPRAGWCIWSSADEVMFVFDGTHWRDQRDLPVTLDNAVHVGINTTASSPNLLSVKSNAALLSAINVADGGSGDARLQISKESAGKTASVFFSDNFSGRAEFGLVGTDAFKLKVSADGSAWLEAFTIDQGSGNLALPRGLALSGVIAPPQITGNQNDYNPSGIASAVVVQLSSDASRTISGLAGGAEGRVVSIVNVGSQPIALSDESVSSTAANRFALGGNLSIAGKQAAILRYDGTAARWRLMSGGTGFLTASNNLSDLGSLAAARANLGVRELLSANRTYYVRTDGSNSNSGLANTSGGAFLTLQKAYDTITQTLDLGGWTVTVQIADGTYSGGVAVTQPWTGGGAVTFQGNGGTPANVVISTTGAHCFGTTGSLPGTLTIKDMKLQTTTSGDCIMHQAVGLVQFTNLVFGACAAVHVDGVGSGVNLECTGNYTISGGGFAHVVASRPSNVSIRGKTITLTGTPAFGGAFALAANGGVIAIDGNTFSGSATGLRFNVQNGGQIYTGGAGTSVLPGSSAGTGTNFGTSPYGLYA